VLDLTPLEKMLQNAGPLRDDGADRFFGLENVRRTLLYPPYTLTLLPISERQYDIITGNLTNSITVWKYMVQILPDHLAKLLYLLTLCVVTAIRSSRLSSIPSRFETMLSTTLRSCRQRQMATDRKFLLPSDPRLPTP
jgi:hypothetical protein